MKKSIVILCVLFMNTLIAQNQKLIGFENEKVKVTHSDEWQITQSPELSGGFFLSAKSDVRDQFKENINLEIDSDVKGLTLKNYALKNIDRLRSSLKNIEIVESEMIMFNDNPTYHVHYTGEMGFLKLKWEKYYFPKGGDVLILSSVCETSKTKDYDDTFNSILETFIIKK